MFEKLKTYVHDILFSLAVLHYEYNVLRMTKHCVYILTKLHRINYCVI